MAGIAVHGNGKLLPFGGCDIDGVDGCKRGNIGRVGHDTHLYHGAVGGAGGTPPKGELQIADGSNCGVDAGKKNALVGTIEWYIGRVVPIETFGATVVGIGGVIIDIGITKIGGAVVGAFPTIDKAVGGGTASNSALKILEIG